MHRLVAFGLNHRTAPLSVREEAAFAPEHLPEALHDLARHGGVNEATILSTCNRTELYCQIATSDSKRALNWFCEYHKLPASTIRSHLYVHPGSAAVKHAFRVASGLDSMVLGETQILGQMGSAAVKHAFRVASGLDSMVLGEPQILGQMKEAFAQAHRAGATGKILNRMFQQTFAVAKQVRTDTAIGVSAVSVAYAAVSLARRIFNRLSEQTVLLIGAGETIELAARHLREQGVKHMIVANRTLERAQLVATIGNGEAITLAEMTDRLSEADIVISSTASQLPILGKGAVERALRIRRHRPIFMVDIAVPRDIEPEVSKLDDVYLYTVDDLQQVVQENLQSRQEAAKEAEKIIDLQVTNFMQWVKSLDSVPTIRALRESAEMLREAELKRAQQRLTQGDDPAAIMAHLARALTNKFTHAPTAALRQADHDGNADLLRAARRLFNLGDDN
ncbi:MAG: glutamyl-tRNA reductase [Gammaproteobacteria bacterium]|nr:glutamyl-tRNA reductase [Gammaproteobacteria bacterium]